MHTQQLCNTKNKSKTYKMKDKTNTFRTENGMVDIVVYTILLPLNDFTDDLQCLQNVILYLYNAHIVCIMCPIISFGTLNFKRFIDNWLDG